MRKYITSVLLAFVIALIGLFTVNVGSASAAMAFHSGFECGSTFEWTSVTGAPSIQSTIKKTGTYAMRCNTSATTAYVTQTATLRRLTLYLYIATAPNVLTTIIGSDSSGGRVRLTTNRYLSFYDGATLRGTSSTQLSTATWYRISIGVGSGAATNWLAINGTKEIQNVTVAALGANRVGVATSSTADIYFDDIAIDDIFSTTDLGDIRITLSLPDAAGNYTQFNNYVGVATHWQNVDDPPGSSFDADYNWDSTNTVKRDSYGLQDCSTIGIGASDTVQAVRSLLRMERGSGSTGSNGGMLRDNNSNYDSTFSLTTSWVWYSRYDAVMPNGDGSWTQARFNTLEAGFAQSAAGNREPYGSALMVMVAYVYTPPPDISNAPSSIAFGSVQPNSSYWSKGSAPSWTDGLNDGECYFAVTNQGSGSVNISIKATSFSGGVGWSLAGSPGVNIVTLKAGKSGDATEANMVTLTTSDLPFIAGLGAGLSKKWEIKLETGTFTDGADKSSTITLTATL